MPAEIILLTDEAEIPHLTAVLLEQNPDLVVTPVSTIDELTRASRKSRAKGKRRLLAYCTSIIVPDEVLNLVDGPAYNFHPGPPSYPGVLPANFAIYDGAVQFGVTAHVMTEQVDEGAIVAVDTFEIAPDSNFNDLEIKAYLALFELFKKLTSQLASSDEPLSEVEFAWGSRKTTYQEYEDLKRQVAFLSAEEKERRQRAFD